MTLTDPFAEAPAESAPTEAPAAPAAAPVASTGTDPKIVLTFKEGTGFDSSWIVVHANNVDDADALLDQKFADLMAKTKKVAAHFRGGSAPSGGGQRPAASTPDSNGRPAGATQPPSWAPPMPDGYLYKTGFNANGAWHAYWPIERNSGLEKIWLKQPK